MNRQPLITLDPEDIKWDRQQRKRLEKESKEAESFGMTVEQYRRFQELKREDEALRKKKAAEQEALQRALLEQRKETRRWSILAVVFFFVSCCLGVILLCGIGEDRSSVAEQGAPAQSTTASAEKEQSFSEWSDKYQIKELPRAPVFVRSGELIKEPSGEMLAPLSISTRGDSSYYVYLKPIAPPFGNSMSFFVHGGSSAEVSVPLGEYEIYYAVGEIWYGTEYMFGDDTTYVKCEGTFDFYEDGSYYQGWTLELYAQTNGNMDTDIISAEDFPG